MWIVGERENRNTLVQLEQAVIQCHAEEADWLIAFVEYYKEALRFERKYWAEHGMDEYYLELDYRDWRQGWTTEDPDFTICIGSKRGEYAASYTRKEHEKSLLHRSEWAEKQERIGRAEDEALDAAEAGIWGPGHEDSGTACVPLVRLGIVCYEKELDMLTGFFAYAKNAYADYCKQSEQARAAICPQAYRYQDWYQGWSDEESNLVMVLSQKGAGRQRLLAMEGYEDKALTRILDAYYEQ
jgi:hypothetical protein